MEREIAALADRWAPVIEAEARKVITASPRRYTAFSAAMGHVCFYGADGLGLDDDDVSERARAVIRLAYAYQEAFGSPGIQI